MRTQLRWLFAVGTLITLVSISIHSAWSESQPPQKRVSQPVTNPQDPILSQFAGNLSCSATSCHGGVTPRDAVIERNEYSQWLAHDRHRNAYQVLLGDRAKIIAKNLALSNPDEKVIAAHEDQRCLACHATPQIAAMDQEKTAVQNFHKAQGVGCEACHGPANQEGKSWLAAHTTIAWKEKSAEEKQSFGMYPVGDLATQATVCAGCHIGAPPDKERGIPARDLNHDLMAAGHPRLIFEFSVYRANMPPHWNLAAKGQEDPKYEAKVWSVGQLATSKAQVELTGYRAGEENAPWPEFAETNCFACHANFQLFPDWRTKKEYYGKRVPGDLPYNGWYSSMLEPIGQQHPLEAMPIIESYSAFALSMSKASPRRTDVVAKAQEVSKALDGWLNKLNGTDTNKFSPGAMLEQILKSKPVERVSERNWDENNQVALAIAALKQDLYIKQRDGDALSEKERTTLDKLNAVLSTLSYPKGSESPEGYHSRAALKTLEQEFGELYEALK